MKHSLLEGEGAEDDAAHRLSNRERKGSIMQELMSDATIRKRAKTQFLKSQDVASAGLKRNYNKSGKGKFSKGGKHGKRR